MSENTTAAVETEIVEGQMDLFTGDVVETVVEETSPLTLEEIVTELIGSQTDYTPYAIAKLINQVFQATSTDKEIPPQMMYIYASKGMLAGKASKGRKIYTSEEVYTFVTKYTSKHVNI